MSALSERKNPSSDGELGSFKMGLRDGLPICIGYFSVSFAFGIYATGMGLGIFEALLMSVFNMTSAGQFAAVPIITAGGSFIELATSQLVINARYALMSLSMSQSMGKSVRLRDKFIIAFACADEPYAVAVSKRTQLSRVYMYSLIALPYFGWSFGTLLGAVAGSILPPSIRSAFGITIYAMFIAIIIPGAKESFKISLSIIVSICLSCAFRYVGVLNKVPSGFAVIICAVLASLLVVAISFIEDKIKGEGEKDR